ncbi:hypothetical protein LTR08_002546 [Meristemomyces frigidus]|nr:hypothetical protein LTR08_002546 [Meristemomyces frigidus]
MALRTLLAASAVLAPVFATPPICPIGPLAPLSCHNTTAIKNTCCTEVQGQVLQVQFWDTQPATGPANHWTIHGLWPDYCDGTYTQYCDESRQYTNISCILEAAGKNDLLAYMRKYWKDQAGGDESFWEHEWGKHGTCYSTLNPSCYTKYHPQEEVVDFFEQVVRLFKLLPTYDFLAAANIYPSATKNYTNTEIMRALHRVRGVNATIECEQGQLYEVEYTFNVKGSVADGLFVPVEPLGEGTNGCPEVIQYLPKNISSTPVVNNTETCSSGLV